MSKLTSALKNKYIQFTGLMLISASSLAADTVGINDIITAESVKPITDSILSVVGIAVGAAFSILGVVVAAKAGIGLIKGFMSRASS
ncbi:TPA: hypothetical protein U2J54_003960 [Providencia rettgeri]|nr:hypothetical protein [Providencia rettgeri]HEM8269033.1 hypothetical protein [Providencia rettgeri]